MHGQTFTRWKNSLSTYAVVMATVICQPMTVNEVDYTDEEAFESSFLDDGVAIPDR